MCPPNRFEVKTGFIVVVLLLLVLLRLQSHLLRD
jgi:hypothetical protein